MAADDDDGNLNNGTPHMTAIFNAFNSHEIACLDTIVQQSGCSGRPNAPPSNIQVVNSNAQVTLTWSSVVNAQRYEVLRTEGVHECAQGKVLLGEVPATETLTWTDTGLQNGRIYYFVIVPKGNSDSCYGPSSECITAIPTAGPFTMSCPNESVIFDLKSVPDQNTRECTIIANDGWSGTVNFACSTSGSFAGVACTAPTSITLFGGSASVEFTIVASASTTKGDGTVTLTATGDGYSTSFITDVLVGKYGSAQMASFSNGSPICTDYGASCDSGSLLDGRGSIGPETNTPNTRDGIDCDGNLGTYHSDESLDRLVVRSLNGDDMVEGTTVEIEATVWAWSTGSSDTLDLYYSDSNDTSNPNWQHIVSLTPTGGGQQIITAQYQLPEGLSHVIRGNFRYNGLQSSCSGGNYDDADDLAFAVRPLAVESDSPTEFPSVSPTESRVPSSEPSLHPTFHPSITPSMQPSAEPFQQPSLQPSSSPSSLPTLQNSRPSSFPSTVPSESAKPSLSASFLPSESPSTSMPPTPFPINTVSLI